MAKAPVRYVGFLRAINVGGRRLTMDQLRQEIDSLGFTAVSTYIASGNVLFSSPLAEAKVEQAIENHLEQALGYVVETFVRNAAEVREISEQTPFDMAPGDSHYVGFLRAKPAAAVRSAVEALSNDTDLLVFVGRELHTRVHGNSQDSTVTPPMLRKALDRQPITSRNITMLRKLAAKLEG